MAKGKSTLKVLSGNPAKALKDMEGKHLQVQDTVTGKTYTARIRIKEVRCGKPNCTKCPHKIYAYAVFRNGKRVREKYLGIAR
jgi:hypothetical protein